MGLSKVGHLTTLRLFYDYFIRETTTIPEAVTTISAGTLRLLLTFISYRAKARKEIRRSRQWFRAAPPRLCCWTESHRVECVRLTRCALTADRCQIASRRAWEASRPRKADAVQVETLTPLSRCAECSTCQRSADVRSCTPPGLYGLRCAAPLHPYIYLIIIGGCADLYSVQRSGGIWYMLEVLRRCDTLQRGAGGIIAVCVGLVSWAVKLGKSQEKRL